MVKESIPQPASGSEIAEDVEQVTVLGNDAHTILPIGNTYDLRIFRGVYDMRMHHIVTSRRRSVSVKWENGTISEENFMAYPFDEFNVSPAGSLRRFTITPIPNRLGGRGAMW